MAARCVEIDPLHDLGWRLLITAHERAGAPAAAERARRRYAEVLLSLGLDPAVAKARRRPPAKARRRSPATEEFHLPDRRTRPRRRAPYTERTTSRSDTTSAASKLKCCSPGWSLQRHGAFHGAAVGAGGGHRQLGGAADGQEKLLFGADAGGDDDVQLPAPGRP